MSGAPRDPAEASGETKDRGFVNALARGLAILRAFRPGELALGNHELAERTGLPRPTVTRLTTTLRELGYLVDHGSGGAVALGPGVLALGYAMLSGVQIRERARSMLSELAREAGATVALGARDRLSAVYLDCHRGDTTITLSLSVGSRIPLATTAMGRAILAALPEGERRYLLRAIRDRDPANYAMIARGVEQAVEDIATRGFCTSFGDWTADVNAVATPVYLASESRLYAINCGGPSYLIRERHLLETCGPRLSEIAAALSQG